MAKAAPCAPARHRSPGSRGGNPPVSCRPKSWRIQKPPAGVRPSWPSHKGSAVHRFSPSRASGSARSEMVETGIGKIPLAKAAASGSRSSRSSSEISRHRLSLPIDVVIDRPEGAVQDLHSAALAGRDNESLPTPACPLKMWDPSWNAGACFFPLVIETRLNVFPVVTFSWWPPTSSCTRPFAVCCFLSMRARFSISTGRLSRRNLAPLGSS
jgi:hypothetical protein